VFAVGDALLALRLQLRHCKCSLGPLPLVSCYNGERALTRSTWRVLAERSVVFWAWRLQAAVLYQAVQADGLLALAGPDEVTSGAIDHYLRRDEPLDLLRKLQRRALPWREAVRTWAAGQLDGAIAELLLGLESYQLELLLRQGKGVVHFAPGLNGLLEIAFQFQGPALE